MLSSLFTNFDQECNRLSLFKIYTIGDCYVVMSFLDKNNRREPKEEANAVTQMGISMIRIINRVRSQLGINLNMRIGIHTVIHLYPKILTFFNFFSYFLLENSFSAHFFLLSACFLTFELFFNSTRGMSMVA